MAAVVATEASEMTAIVCAVLTPVILAPGRVRESVRLLAAQASSTTVILLVVAIAAVWLKMYRDGVRLGWWAYIGDLIRHSM